MSTHLFYKTNTIRWIKEVRERKGMRERRERERENEKEEREKG